MVKGRFSLPDRWTDYDAVGDVIPGTRFIAFKVPLRLQYFHRKGLEREIFTTSDLNEKLGDKLRLVVDLSCKQVGMYYNPEDLEKNGIRYEKLRVEGKKVPSEHIIKRFKRIVTEFEKRQPEDYYIGVHCTHGVNRTGYVICRYMIEQLSKTTDEALRAFKAGRGYPLERENYIEALHKFEKDACVVKDRNTGHSKGYGFVEFARESDAENAMKQMSGAVRGRKPIRANWASHKKTQSKGEAKEYNSVFDKTSESNTTVYIGNTPDSFSETEVRNMFDTFGQILEVRVYPDRNYAFVKYSDHDQAAQAIVGCHGHTVQDRPIRCDWGKEDNQPKFPGYGQDGSHSTFMGQGSNSAATSHCGFGYQQQ
ncbi:RNA/RNP complex-1-interacting phosphatase-like isoform X3 [Apostichopus japonicus]